MKADGILFRPAAAFLAACLSFAAAEAGADEPASSSKTEWTVGVAALTVPPGDDGTLASAAALVSRLIGDELTGVDEHLLDDSEREELARAVIGDEETKAWRKIAALRSSRDALFFEPNADPAKLRDLDESLRIASREARRWKNMPMEAVIVPRSLSVSFPTPSDGGSIWFVGDSSPEAFRRKNGLDVLVGGSMLRVGDYYGIRISAWTDGGEISLWEGAASDSELEGVSSEAGAVMRRLVLGRAWSSLTVQTDPPGALITVNGRTVGVGFWSDSVLRPGAVTLEVTAHGYEPALIAETLAESESKSLDVVLEKTALDAILVRSDPPGADLRIGTLWLGRTPLSVERPDRVMPLSLELDGFRSRTVPLSPDTERLTVPLESRITDSAQEYSIARKRLYNSIAVFSASLAPTIALLGISRNFANMNILAAGPPANQADLDYSYRAYMISYGMMWGSVAVNLGLLTNVLVRLNRYLNAAEGLSD